LMSNTIPIIGSLSLGIVIGWLVRYFIRRFRTFTPTVLGSVISLLFGGVAIKLLGGDKTVFWCYPIGVLVGFISYSAVAIIAIGSQAKGKGKSPYDGPVFCPAPIEIGDEITNEPKIYIENKDLKK
jgi:hypothetical protein